MNKREAMAFAKVNNHCAGIQEDISSIQVNDDNCSNLLEASNSTNKGEAMAFAKVGNRCAGIQEDISFIQVNDNNCSNLLEASNSKNEEMMMR